MKKALIDLKGLISLTVQCLIPNGIKLEINKKKDNLKIFNFWKFRNALPRNV